MRFPYGIADFRKMREEGYFYVDRTDRIPLIEEAGSQLLFLRPRRAVAEALRAAEAQLAAYRETLERTADQQLKLRTHAVVGSGLERLVFAAREIK